jgi:predicted SAM-dependent methyltransferase
MVNPKLKFYEFEDFNPTLKQTIKFTVKNFIHKKLFFWYANIKPKNAFLNLGCGPNIIENFDNADVPAIRLWRLPHIPINLFEKLPFKDNSYEGVYTEHTLEHLTPRQAMNLLNEIKRILKPNGHLRIVVPDLDIYIANAYKRDERLNNFLTTAESFWSLTQNWGHKNVYNYEILEALLTDLGYCNIIRQEFNKGNSGMLIDQDLRKWESLYVEAQKL